MSKKVVKLVQTEMDLSPLRNLSPIEVCRKGIGGLFSRIKQQKDIIEKAKLAIIYIEQDVVEQDALLEQISLAEQEKAQN